MPSFDLENALSQNLVAGIDEAGRGPLAGPVSAAAVIFPKGYQPDWLNILDDSKKLSEKKREELYLHITEDEKLSWAIASASAQEVDEINILQATHLAVRRADQALSEPPQHCLIDGRPVKDFPFPSDGIVKGDSKSYSIAAASILAKVSRDRLLLQLDAEFPQYQFAKHKGYGTKVHLEALKKHGPCREHRLTFRPVQAAVGAKATQA